MGIWAACVRSGVDVLLRLHAFWGHPKTYWVTLQFSLEGKDLLSGATQAEWEQSKLSRSPSVDTWPELGRAL